MVYKDFTSKSFKLKDLAEFSSQVFDSTRPLGEGVYPSNAMSNWEPIQETR
jgi:hypothetical protein